jgi:hypothetical protein
MQEPVALFAALGFIAVFAGAANTPLACTMMGIELFGAHYAVYFGVACFHGLPQQRLPWDLPFPAGGGAEGEGDWLMLMQLMAGNVS